MTQRPLISLALTLSLAMTAPAFGQSSKEEIVDRLKTQGFERITVTRTFLGRVRIVGEGATGTREIVLNPSNGTILRDYSESTQDDDARDEDEDDEDLGTDVVDDEDAPEEDEDAEDDDADEEEDSAEDDADEDRAEDDADDGGADDGADDSGGDDDDDD